MDLIRKEDAIKALYRYRFVSKQVIEEEINDLDAVEVVRCKDCKHCKKKKGTFRGEPIFFYRCEEHNRDVESDDFCSFAERRDK